MKVIEPRTRYERDLYEAAKSDGHYDVHNANEIGVYHGREPNEVLREIRALRQAMLSEHIRNELRKAGERR